MRRRTGLIALIVIAALLIVAVALMRGHKAETGPEAVRPASLRLAWVYDMAEAGVFVAKDQSYFRKNGLDLQIEQGGFGLDPLKLVAAGTNDFGVAGAGNLLLARAQGVPVVAVAAEFQHTPVGFIARKDSGIHSFRDFSGKRVGIQTGADTDVLYRALLARNGMSSRDVHEVPIQYDPSPFVAGRIDILPGYVTNQPVTLRSKGLEVDVISAASQGLNYYGNVYFTSEKMIREHPDRVREFVNAARQAWMAAMRDPTLAINAIQARSKDFNSADLKTIYSAVIPFIKPDPGTPLLGMTAQRWEATAEVLRDAGLLKAKIDVSKAYTDAFTR